MGDKKILMDLKKYAISPIWVMTEKAAIGYIYFRACRKKSGYGAYGGYVSMTLIFFYCSVYHFIMFLIMNLKFLPNLYKTGSVPVFP